MGVAIANVTMMTVMTVSTNPEDFSIPSITFFYL
jgi:hypothetical protein